MYDIARKCNKHYVSIHTIKITIIIKYMVDLVGSELRDLAPEPRPESAGEGCWGNRGGRFLGGICGGGGYQVRYYSRSIKK